MVASIQSSGVSQGSGPGAGGDASSVALQAQLRRCERQLGDWEACASSKTPEGRKIIENLRARIGTLESRIASSGKDAAAPAGSADAARDSRDAGSSVGGSYQAISPMATATVGSLLNVFA